MRITKVKYLSGYKLAVTFSDDTEKTVNLFSFLSGATNPMTTKYRNKILFKQVSISHGHLTWNNEMDIHALDILL